MRRIVFLCLMLFCVFKMNSQTNQLWKGYFSYSDVKDIAQSNEVFLAASENSLFQKNLTNSETKTLNTIDGLSSQSISCIYKSTVFKKTLIGYQNGLLLIINDADGVITKRVDILNKQLPPNIKKINHFFEHQNVVYLSCDFGIVVFNLSTNLFGDTYFIGNSPSDIKVNQVSVLDGFIYAATANYGLKRANLSNPNLIDALLWTEVVSGSFVGVCSFANTIFAVYSYGQIIKSSNGLPFSNFGSSFAPALVDIRSNANNLVVTTPNIVVVYNSNLAVVAQISNANILNITTNFTCATTINTDIYIGTTTQGVIKTTVGNIAAITFISPSGPFQNFIFSINAKSKNLWAVYGNYSESFEPQEFRSGFSRYNSTDGWVNIPYSATQNTNDLVRVTVNPKNENQLFISSHSSGLLKIEDDVVVQKYTPANSGLENLIFIPDPNYKSCRIEETAFDKNGNLWTTNGLLKAPLKVLKTDGQWQSINLESVMYDFGDARFSKLFIDKNSTKWMVSRSDGLIGFNENYNNRLKRLEIGTAEGNLPGIIQTAVIDNRNQIWIGTRKGLRVLSSVDAFLSDEPLKSRNIIINDNNLGQELLNNQFITDIVVDGANNKWVGTADAGVFKFSSNGQETFYHFTTTNSPLPSNNVNDIDINPLTGEVFFATTKGMVSFKGSAIKAVENLENVVVFPNPVRPDFNDNVTITGLTNKANIKITDIEGNLVFEKISEGGSVEWDTTAFAKYRVSSGVYMVFIAAADGVETKVKKIMIIR